VSQISTVMQEKAEVVSREMKNFLQRIRAASGQIERPPRRRPRAGGRFSSKTVRPVEPLTEFTIFAVSRAGQTQRTATTIFVANVEAALARYAKVDA
jgi:hypothetical protein